MRSWALLVGCGLLAVILGGACASGPSGTTVVGLPADGEYRSVAESTFPLVDATTVRVTIGGGTLGFSAGCNTASAAVRAAGDRLVAEDFVQTQMGCADELMDQDDRLVALFTSRPVIASSPDGFTLTAADGRTLVFVERSVVDPDRMVEGTRWLLDGVVDGATATSAEGFASVQLVIEGGVATVESPCSRGTAPARLDGGSLVLGPLELDTRTASCPPGVRQGEAALVAVFGGTAEVEVGADVLDVRRGQTTVILRER